MSFRERLRIARKNAELTQAQVANELGIDKSTYSGYETGKSEPDILKVQKLSYMFNVTSDFLIIGKDSTKFQNYTPDIISVTLIPPLTNHEGKVVTAYRAHVPEVQHAVDRLLGVKSEKEETEIVFMAAKGGKRPGAQRRPKGTMAILKAAAEEEKERQRKLDEDFEAYTRDLKS